MDRKQATFEVPEGWKAVRHTDLAFAVPSTWAQRSETATQLGFAIPGGPRDDASATLVRFAFDAQIAPRLNVWLDREVARWGSTVEGLKVLNIDHPSWIVAAVVTFAQHGRGRVFSYLRTPEAIYRWELETRNPVPDAILKDHLDAFLTMRLVTAESANPAIGGAPPAGREIEIPDVVPEVSLLAESAPAWRWLKHPLIALSIRSDWTPKSHPSGLDCVLGGGELGGELGGGKGVLELRAFRPEGPALDLTAYGDQDLARLSREGSARRVEDRAVTHPTSCAARLAVFAVARGADARSIHIGYLATPTAVFTLTLVSANPSRAVLADYEACFMSLRPRG
ncbi:MAG: hypothetical protein U0271_08210 [Polyangiaceae bacterium]